MKFLYIISILFLSNITIAQSTNPNAKAYEMDSAIQSLENSVEMLGKMAEKAKREKDSIILIPTEITSIPTSIPVVPATKPLPSVEEHYTVELHYSQFPLPKDHKLYKRFPNLQETMVLGIFRYTVGKFSTEKKAEQFIDYIKEQGHMGSIVKYINGRRVLK